MDTETHMTFTSVALIVMLVIMLLMFICHFLGCRLLSSFWLRSNKEEKIELSATKLFHANGYMLHSGSDFLLSTSGSFKRFDAVDKEDCKQQTAYQQQHQQQQQQQPQSTQQASTPLWNLPQQEEIPPQPLRPAPQVPGTNSGPSKTVTFSFKRIDEAPTMTQESCKDNMPINVNGLISCMRTGAKFSATSVPQPIDAPPAATRLSISTSTMALSGTAIPRPLAKRQISLQNGNAASANDRPKANGKLLTRRNSSTNPFLCEGLSLEESAESHGALSAEETQKVPCEGQQNGNFHNNPFFEGSGDGNSFDGHDEPINTADVDSDPNRADLPQLCRNRSFSDSEPFKEMDLKVLSNRIMSAGGGLLRLPIKPTNPFADLTQKIKGPHMLQKTISEDFLLRKICNGPTANGHVSGGIGNRASSSTNRLGRCMLRQNSTQSLGGQRHSSQCSLESSIDYGSISTINLEHAISCESVNSDTGPVFLSSLDQTYTQITGYLYVGLQYDKNSMTADGMELGVSVLQAKGLICPFSVPSLDTFVRIYLVPDQAAAMHTNVFENSTTPNYNETFTFWLKKQQGRHSLWFHLYHNGETHTLIGEAEMEIGEIPRSVTTWIPLSDSRKCNAQWGELMFSLSYLPTAERLTIVVVKARNLRKEVAISSTPEPQQVQSVFVKVYLMNNDKKVLKKRTSLKRSDCGTIFNEAMIFSLPPHSLTTVQLRLTVFAIVGGASGARSASDANIVAMGHVIAGSCSTGKGLRHWHQMLSSLRKPVAMWHVLRRVVNQPVFTGGAEAVVEALQSNANSMRTKRNSVF